MGGGAKREAEAKASIARQQLAQAEREREYAVSRAETSASELENQRVLNEIRQQVVGQGQKELDFLRQGLDLKSPGASAAGQGIFSEILMRQRQAQQGLLESQLRQRLGAGYATTSAGMAAMNQFRQQTADLATQMIPQVIQAQTAATTQAGAYEDALKKRAISASQGSSLVPYQGANEIYNLEMARANQGLWSSGGKAVGAIGGGIAGFFASGGNPLGAMAGASIGASALGGGGGGGNEGAWSYLNKQTGQQQPSFWQPTYEPMNYQVAPMQLQNLMSQPGMPSIGGAGIYSGYA